MSRKIGGLIYGPLYHHLDHLAILCHLMEIPLIVTEEEMAEAARKYYPDLKILCYDYMTATEKVVREFDVIFYSTPRALFDDVFFFAERMVGKRLFTIWCPHGNSDKGHASNMMETLEKEKVALVYGPKMLDFIGQRGVHLPSHVVLGNYRYTYYRRYKHFYDKIVSKEIPARNKVILYAPTWQDLEKSSSFFEATPILIDMLPSAYSLIIKLHPNLTDFDVEKIIMKYENHPDVLFVRDFPPIYPLLDLASIYIGDMSSIGYDFLSFDRPMFFFNPNKRDPRTDPGLYLYRCGVSLVPEEYEKIYDLIEKTEDQKFSEIRNEVYDYTFGKERSFETIREEIVKTIERAARRTPTPLGVGQGEL